MSGLKKIARAIIDFLLYGNVVISLGAVALLWLTYLQLGRSLAFDHLTGLVFFGTWFDYTLQRRLSMRTLDEPIATPLMDWLSRYGWLQKGILVFSGIGVGYHLYFLLAAHWLLLGVVGALALLYSFPLRWPGGKTFRLREIGLVKVLLVAFVWGCVTALLPFHYLGEPFYSVELLIIFTQRFLLIFALLLPFEVRDVKVDRAYHIKTLPQVLGRNNTLYLGMGLLLAVPALEGWRLILASQNALHFQLAFLLVALVGVGLFWQSRKVRSDYFYLGWIDGLCLLQFLLAWLFISF